MVTGCLRSRAKNFERPPMNPSLPARPVITKPDRRNFLKHSAMAVAGAAVAGRSHSLSAQPESPRVPSPILPSSQGKLPTGRLGQLTVSRLISGGNLLSGWCHQRDLLFVRNLASAYLTESKQFDTLQLLEESGVNSLVIDQVQLEIVNKYRKERGGKMQTIVGVRQGWGDWGDPQWPGLKDEIRQAIDRGANTPYLHGGYADRLVQSGRPERVELIGRALQFIREQRLPAGLGSHALEVPQACDRAKIEPDYYVKTFHHDRYWSATPRERRKPFSVDGPRSLDHNEFHDNIFCLDPEATAEYMLEKAKPWIAFKVLAAGAISPQSGFKYAFENGADFIAVGMFDFEVEEDVRIARDLLKQPRRERTWFG